MAGHNDNACPQFLIQCTESRLYKKQTNKQTNTQRKQLTVFVILFFSLNFRYVQKLKLPHRS